MMRKATAIALAAAIAVAAAWQSDKLLLDLPERLRRSGAERVRRALAAAGVLAAWSFDGPEVTETLTGAAARTRGAALVDAPFGKGREFSGAAGESISTGFPWGRLGEAWTLTLRVKILAPSEFQGLVSSGASFAGLRLHEGAMVFSLSPGGQPFVGYPFTNYGRYVHLAAVADPQAGELRLYEDGELKASSPIAAGASPDAGIVFGQTLANRAAKPLRAVFDQAVCWGRVLTPSEVRDLARSGRSLEATSWRLAPGGALRHWAGGALAALADDACALVDAFNPALGWRRVADAPGVQTLSLVLSNKDQRAIDRWFKRSRARGLELNPEQAQQRVAVNAGGTRLPARLTPYAPAEAYREHPKHSFILELEEPLSGFGNQRRLLLVPPETRGLLLPLVREELARRHRLPQPGAGLVALRVNGFFKGFYHCEPWRPPGPVERLELEPPLDPVGTLPLADAEVLEVYDRLRERFEPLLRGDRVTPVTTRRLARLLDRDRRRLEETLGSLGARTDRERADATAGWLREELFLNGNPAPQHLLHDLDLAGPELPGLTISWSSSNPGVLDDRGRVRRPAGGPPVQVELEATVGVHGVASRRVLRYAVIPLAHRLSVLSLAVSEEVNNDARVPCTADYYDAQGGLQAGSLTGGLKFRGNTALLRPKKSFSLRLAESGVFFPGSASRVSYLMSGYTDASYLNDRLSYDLFRDFGAGGGRRPAVRIFHLVVYVNGEYQGLYQISERVDRHLLGLPAARAGDAAPGLVFKAQDSMATFSRPVIGAYRQIEPDPEIGDFRGELRDFISFIATAERSAFAAEISRRVDAANFLDYLLLANISRNLEGVNYNFYLARDPRSAGPFFFVPWDFDKAYRRGTTGWLNNHLSFRLLREDPAFAAGVGRRWRELRAGPLAGAAIDARLERYATEVGPSAEVDRQRWQPGAAAHPEAVETLRRWLHGRLAAMDRIILEREGAGMVRQRPHNPRRRRR